MSEFEILTYRQLSDRLGISLESVRKKVRRRKWRVVPGNRPSDPVRVHVPVEALAEAPEPEPDEAPAPAPADPQLLSTLKALEAYVGRVSGQQEQLLGELSRLVAELAAKDAAHGEEIKQVRAEERERYREELDIIAAAHEQERASRVEEITRLLADIERERTDRKDDEQHYRGEIDRQWKVFLEERENHFESLERERMATAKAEARAYRSEATAKEMRTALVAVVPRLDTMLRQAAAPQEPPSPQPADIAESSQASGSPPADGADPDGPASKRRSWWRWGRQ
ncbi:MAG TPA: hypothetical protein VFO41_08305 [Alphaproteobacteria bacterium]|nr:hypothetical protein [Alphaproteobacteria bacterium]